MPNGIHTSVIKDITSLLHIKAFNFGWFGSWQIFSQFVLKTMQGLWRKSLGKHFRGQGH